VKPKPMRQVALRMTVDPDLIHLAAAFAEQSAAAFKLDKKSVLALTLATEELVEHLSRTAARGGEIEILCKERVYCVEEAFLLPDRNLDLRAFNLTARVSPEDESSLEETGLIIASRMVDGFRLKSMPEGLMLTLIKEKAYPELSGDWSGTAKPLESFSVRPPDSEELKTFVHMALTFYQTAQLPLAFRFPGKVVDMAAAGEFTVLIATDQKGNIGGGILLHISQNQVVEAAGPYIFGQEDPSRMAAELIEACIASLARTGKIGLILRHPTRHIPEGWFELLGTLEPRGEDGKVRSNPFYYRQIEEDLGTAVWCHPDLQAYLSGEYTRLGLARHIRTVSDLGETPSPYSVIFVTLDPFHEEAILRPVWWNKDAEQNLADHLALLEKESLSNILFAMDLGSPWHVRFTPMLLRQGFEPRIVMPYGGASDLLLFQHPRKGAPK